MNQVDSSSYILPNELCLADRDGVRIIQAKHTERMAYGLAQLELSQVRRTRGEETAVEWWPSWLALTVKVCADSEQAMGANPEFLSWEWG